MGNAVVSRWEHKTTKPVMVNVKCARRVGGADGRARLRKRRPLSQTDVLRETCDLRGNATLYRMDQSWWPNLHTRIESGFRELVYVWTHASLLRWCNLPSKRESGLEDCVWPNRSPGPKAFRQPGDGVPLLSGLCGCGGATPSIGCTTRAAEESSKDQELPNTRLGQVLLQRSKKQT